MNHLNIAYYFALLIGFGTLIIGICAVIKPKPMASKFGVLANESALPYVISTGIRDVFIGLTVLISFYLHQWTALGAIHLAIGIVAISDFKVVNKYGNKKVSYVHLFGAIVVISYGIWLLK